MEGMVYMSWKCMLIQVAKGPGCHAKEEHWHHTVGRGEFSKVLCKEVISSECKILESSSLLRWLLTTAYV